MNALWFRVLVEGLLIVGGIVVFILTFKKQKLWEKIIIAICIVGLSILMCFLSLKPALNPKLETVKVQYVEEYREKIIGMTYVFENENKKYFLNIDSFSKNKVFPNKFTKNTEYDITYEIQTDTIMGVSVLEK